MEAPREPPATAPQRDTDPAIGRATGAAVLALTALAAAAASALWLARGRELADALGAEAAALAAAAVLLAFALGAGTLGAGAGRQGRALAACGVLLLAGTAFTLLWPAGLAHLRGFEPGAPAVLLGLWLLLGPPAFLAGGALPFAARAIEDRAPQPGALVVGAAALGAGAGRWVAAFHLVGDVDLDATANVATALFLVLGVVAVALGRGAGWRTAGASAALDAGVPPRAWLTASAALLGASALALERLGARELDLVAGPTAHSAWAAAAAFAALFGCGALLAVPCGPGRAPAAAALGALLAVLAGVAALLVTPVLGVAFGELSAMRANAWPAEGLLALAALALAAPALGLGLAFGALAGTGRWMLQRALAAAALGAAAGVLLLELGPALERQLALRIALALIPAAVALRFRPTAEPAVARCALLAAAVLALTWTPFPPRERLVGAYLGGRERHFELASSEPAFVAEGPRADLLVLTGAPADPADAPRGALFVDGRRVDDAAGRALGWLPRLLNPGARTALLDGLGTGRAARALLELGAIEVVCAEPRDALVAAAPHLGHLQGAPTPSFTRVRADLRQHLHGEGPRYDLILVDASAPWTRGATTRLSTEFFQAAGARLETYGLVALALPTRTLHAGQLALVIRTATGVFPDAALLDAGQGLVLLVLTPRGLLPRVEEVDAAQALLDGAPRTSAELAAAFGSADVRTLLLERLWLGVEPLRAFAARHGDGERITDAHPALELAAFRGELFAALAGGLSLAETELLSLSASDPGFRTKLFLDWRAATAQLEALRAHKTRCFKLRLFAEGLALVQLGLTYEPDEPEFTADLLLFGDLEPRDFEARRRRLLERSPTETFRLGRGLAQLERLEQARAVLAGLVERHPHSALALSALADVDAALGNTALAAEERERARALDPLTEAMLAERPPP